MLWAMTGHDSGLDASCQQPSEAPGVNPHVFRLYVVELQWQVEAALRAMDALDELILQTYGQAIADMARILRRGHKYAALPSCGHSVRGQESVK